MLALPADFAYGRTKIAIRMSRISDKHKDSLLPEPEEDDSDISEDEEETEDGDREETPDLYRNSSLGMYVLSIRSFVTVFTDSTRSSDSRG